MENILYIALTRQMAMEQKMDVLANNLANASTLGYKGEQLLFAEYLSEPDENGTTSLVQDVSIIRNYGQGPLVQSKNPLDVAIHGKGWFELETDNGRLYTRDGSFRLDPEGQLVNSNGDVVLNDSGEPIVFTPLDTEIVIAKDGSISTSLGPRGSIGVVQFENENLMQKVGGNAYTTSETPLKAIDVTVVQGMTEQSNVQSVVEVTKMIEALRAYQSAQKLIEAELALQDQTITTLTESPGS